MTAPKFILQTGTHYLPVEEGLRNRVTLRLVVDLDVSAIRDFIYESQTFAAIDDPGIRSWPLELWAQMADAVVEMAATEERVVMAQEMMKSWPVKT